MPIFKAEQIVQIPCEIEPGAFAGEYLITIRAEDTVLSGFVKREYLTTTKGSGFVSGKILKVTVGAVTVLLPGSFFTTAAGMAALPSEWATKNLQEASA